MGIDFVLDKVVRHWIVPEALGDAILKFSAWNTFGPGWVFRVTSIVPPMNYLIDHTSLCEQQPCRTVLRVDAGWVSHTWMTT